MSKDIDPVTGLPEELDAWDNIKKEDQTITVRIEKKKFGKEYTIIEGINENEVDLEDVARELKNKFACGGTVKEGVIQLQGDHRRRLKDKLDEMGFAKESIEYE